MRCPHALAILAFLAYACVGQPFTCADADPLVCASLGDLYDATSGPSWVFQTGWSNASAWTGSVAGPAPSYCDFYGVSCTSSGAVTQLCVCCRCAGAVARRRTSFLTLRAPSRSLLTSNRLTGSLPDSLGSLSSLVFLCVPQLLSPAKLRLCSLSSQLSERERHHGHAAVVSGQPDQPAVTVRPS